MMSNMQIWDAVSKTDPKYTTQVNQRGGFTSVNANAQVMAATAQFGPIGQGWGYDAGAPVFTPQDLIIVPVTLWHGTRENVFGPELGCAELVSKTKNGPRVDSDAPKKATTDALTKLLSRLGFNADVFLGLYDDNKYVAEMEREFAEKPATITEDQATELQALIDGVSFPLPRLFAVVKENTGFDLNTLKDLPASEFGNVSQFLTSQKKAA